MEKNSNIGLQNISEQIVIDFGEICRFCLADTNSNILIYDECLIDDSAEVADSICNFITKLSSIKMEGTENFPSLVCKNCYELIKVCYNFSQVCQQSDKSLRDCYEKTLNKTKAKLNCSDTKESGIKNHEAEFKVDILSENMPMESNELPLSFSDTQEIRNERVKWSPSSSFKSRDSLSVLKAGNIKLKYQRINSLSERLKKAQSKLAEDILRSNDMMLGLPRSYNMKRVLLGQKLFYNCPQCSSKFASLEALKFHYMATHELVRFKIVMKFQCKKCIKVFSEQEKLKKHYEKIHNNLNPSEEDLSHKVNKSIRVGKKKFYCLHCVPYKIFRTQDELVKHLKVFHGMTENISNSTPKVYSCGLCESETTFSSKSSLSRHLRTAHYLKEKEITLEEISFRSKTSDSEPDENLRLKLFKVFLCTDCVPPVSFTNVNVCVQHKMEIHEKQMDNTLLKELSAVYVDSLDIFKQSQEKNFEINFKVLCKNCNPPMEFTSTSEFVNHVNFHHSTHEATLENWNIQSKLHPVGKNELKKDSQIWKCSECSSSYFRRQSLYYHMKEKHNKYINLGAIKCPEADCSQSFFTNRQLIQHGISFHQKYFAHFHKLFKRKILHNTTNGENKPIKNLECDICQKKYVCKNSLKRHILKTHLGKVEVNSVQCPYCDKTLSNKLNLKSHIEFVHEALFISCPICKKKINFRTIGKHYKIHQANHGLVDSKNLFLCNLCGKILKSKRGFEDHQKLHKNVRDHLCDVCGTGFTTKKFLHVHKKTHEGVQRKIFECHQCDKVFSGRHTLNRHLLTHSGEKNFICEICSKCFYTLQELNRHVRCHKKEYRFDCQLCEMRFLDKSRFRHHMMRHRNIRPHKCQFCDKMFIVRGKMNLHMAAKHGVEIQTTKAVWKDPKTYIPLDDLL